MNRRHFLTITTATALTTLARVKAEPSPTLEATVTVFPARELGRIDKKVYGHFLEHIEDIVYGGIYDPTAKAADKWGIRQDVVQAIKDMGGAHVLRWPGGNFVSGYHWEDGIGPRLKRPRRLDLAFNQYESNHFGTDEYLELCRQLQCEPFITANMGSGTVEEACRWVEYCRRPDASGRKRQPPVQIWGLGNEHFGPWQLGAYTPEEYAHKAKQYARFMRVVEPDLRFVGVGYNRDNWNQTVLKQSGDLYDWLSIHLYAHRTHLEGKNDFDTTVAMPAFFEDEIKTMIGHIDAYEKNARRKEPLKICLEEWNTRHFESGHKINRRSPRNLTDALFVAGVYNVCHRQAARVGMGNYIYLLNAHAPITIHGNTVVKSATYDVFRLYATVSQPLAVQSAVKADPFTVSTKDVASGQPGQPDTVTANRLDVSATRSEDGKRMTLFLSNLNETESLSVRLNVEGRNLAPGGTVHRLHHDNLLATNTPQLPNLIRSKTQTLTDVPNRLDLLPHSLTVLEVGLS